VSITRRFINFARSELNDLLDKAAETDGRDGPAPDDEGYSIDDSDDRKSRVGPHTDLSSLTDEELTAEIERRRRAAERGETAEPRRPASSPPRSSAADLEIVKAYAALEIPPGSDFTTVRKAYRALMRKYHPDRHTATPEKQKAANELAQKLTQAYDLLEKRLRR
jgi:DnaJ-domain-containing protein 1